jgi:protein gp37
VSPTKISWTDETWNPTVGCARVSPGCQHCYAEGQAGRIVRMGGPAAELYRPLVRFAGGTRREGRWNGHAAFVPARLSAPMAWRQPRRVFVDSMSDVFHKDITDEQVAAIFGVMVLAAQNTYQVLTKRPERMRDFFARYSLEDCLGAAAAHRVPGPGRHNWPPRREWFDVERWPAPWIWLGVSVEDQARADERIPLLLQVPAAVRFISAEPLLGPVNLRHLDADAAGHAEWCQIDALTGQQTDMGRPCRDVGGRLGWVIAGCESGGGARPCDVAWLRALRDQCAAGQVPFFLKQAVTGPGLAAGDGSHFKSGGVVELPYLDGVQHAAFPAVAP